jgi:hypothetical protein
MASRPRWDREQEDAMPTDNRAGNDIADLREVLLAFHEEDLGNFPLPAMRAAARLHRFKLSWVLGPWVLAGMVRRIPRVTRRSATEQRLVRLYAQASGNDPDVTRAEVHRIQSQLGLIDQRSPNWQSSDFAGCRPASRAELQAAAGALLGYFLGSRQTDDVVLAETQAAYATHEQWLQDDTAVFAEDGRRQARRHRKASRQEQIAALRRYAAAWRRWFDQAQEGSHGAR